MKKSRLYGTQIMLHVCLAALATPLLADPAPETGLHEVKVIRDITYKTNLEPGSYEAASCKLDLYLPANKKDFPVVVWFHGGGLEGGNKSSDAGLGQHIASQGIAVASVNYRLFPKAKYPSYLEDAAASVAWTYQHIGEYGGNNKQFFVSGHSAGGYLAADIGYDPKYLAAQGLKTDIITGLIPVSGQMFTHFTIRKEHGVPNPEVTPVIDADAPCYHARKDAPPTLILIGDHDWATRLEESEYFLAVLHTMGHPNASLRVIANRDHGSILNKMKTPGDPGFAAFQQFIESLCARQQAQK